MSAVDAPSVAPGTVWRLAWRVSQHDRRSFWFAWICWAVFFTVPAISGWILARGFDALADGHTATVVRWAALLAVAEMFRMAVINVGALQWTTVWVQMQTLLRANLLVAQVASGGEEAGRPVASAGEALTHFRDDTEDVAWFVDGLVDVSGGVVFTVAAGLVLGAADARAAAILLLPLLGIAVATRALDTRIKAYRAADRAATAAVTGLVGDTMAAATTVKVNDAVEPVLGRLGALVTVRQRTAVRDRVLDEGVQAFSQGAADIGLGLVLLVSAGAIASGSFGVGVLALFTAYLGWLSFLPRMVGKVLARRKQAGVAFERMRHLVADEDVDRTTTARSLPIDGRRARHRSAAVAADVRPPRVPLERLDVEHLTARFDGGGGIDDVSFSLERGSFTVVTGEVGAGKSTLLRAVLGLAWDATASAGVVRWNGRPLGDRAAFLVPPNAAFLPQVPHLVSDSVRENVGLGPVGDHALARALDLAVIDDDVAALPDGTTTLIGPRGLRLSGGQRQRLATARALVHAPEVVVLDDLSSALDVETELRLWERLADAGMTVLAVSHRAVALERADQVLRLVGGRLAVNQLTA